MKRRVADLQRAIMLSYQHSYHAGNMADVQKHSLLAWMLTYLVQKPKPLTYIETHAGRGLYRLDSVEALKTTEAQQGVKRAEALFEEDHPYRVGLDRACQAHGAEAYPGSPLLARTLLRDTDALHLSELHPTENQMLQDALPDTRIYREDGFAQAHALIPPTPRRGLMLIDPSYEIKEDYQTIPAHIRKWHKAWNVGIIVLWYPLLTNGAQKPMLRKLCADHVNALRLEVHFPPVKPGHGMIGSGLFVLNAPYGLKAEAEKIHNRIERASRRDCDKDHV